MGIFNRRSESIEAERNRKYREAKEGYFWSQIIVRAMPSADEAQVKKLKKRFAPECEFFVALRSAEVLEEPTQDRYHRSSEQFLAEVAEKVRAIRSEFRK